MKGITTRFTELLGRLRQAVAVFANRQQQGPRVVVIGSQTFVERTPPNRHSTIPGPIWLLLTERLGRLAQRFRALIARVEAGTLPQIRPARIRPATSHPPAPRLPIAHLPSGRGWINARIPDAAPCAGALIVLLQDPAMPELIARAPQAGRLLRPICRALAVDLPDWLRLPPRPRKPIQRKPRLARAPKIHPRRRSLPIWYPSPAKTQKNRP